MTIKEAVAAAMDEWKSSQGAGFDPQHSADFAQQLFEEALAEWLDENGYDTDHNEE